MSERSQVEARARSLHELLDRHLRPASELMQITELGAVGVSRSRIASLYPGEILDLAPRLEVLMHKKPIPPDATKLDESLVELETRYWTFTTLHPRHAQQVMQFAFATERTGYIDFGKGRRAAVVESMNLRMLFALIELLRTDAFEAVGGELPWEEIDAFLSQADESLRLVHLLLEAHSESPRLDS